jgi:tight adherence protein C
LRIVERLVPARDQQARIMAAGEPGGLSVREWIAIKVACAAAGTLAAVTVAGALPGRLWIAAIFCGPLAGFLLPDFWLGRAAALRAQEAERQLPDMLDLLRVALEAGMPAQRAIASVAGRFDGSLATEWRRMAAAGALGAPIDQSLSELAERLPAPAVKHFAETMRSASRYGLSLGDALASLAGAARHARQQRIREHSARAAPKIQLVVALVLVPSVMLVIAAGMVAQLGGSAISAA